MRQHGKRSGRRQKARRSAKVGLPPGTVQSDPNASETKIRAICYGPGGLEELQIARPSQLPALLKRWPNVWIDVAGLGSAQTIAELGQVLNLHPLAVEDAAHVHQRAKVDDFGDHLFIVARMSNPGDNYNTEQCSIFLRTGMLATFQEREGDNWGSIRERLRLGRGPLRDHAVDYLAYLLLDAMVDSYFPTLEAIGDQLDTYDQRLGENDLSQNFQHLHDTRHQLLSLRRAIRPHRDMVNELVRDDCQFIRLETRVFLRDCQDHVIQLLDMVESYRELASDLRSFQMSLVGLRMNEIMKVLTVISTIFMPLSFLVGLYGMNFNTDSPWNMPELNWRFGYLFSLGLMLTSALGMLYFFRRRGWF